MCLLTKNCKIAFLIVPRSDVESGKRDHAEEFKSRFNRLWNILSAFFGIQLTDYYTSSKKIMKRVNWLKL